MLRGDIGLRDPWLGRDQHQRAPADQLRRAAGDAPEDRPVGWPSDLGGHRWWGQTTGQPRRLGGWCRHQRPAAGRSECMRTGDDLQRRCQPHVPRAHRWHRCRRQLRRVRSQLQPRLHRDGGRQWRGQLLPGQRRRDRVLRRGERHHAEVRDHHSGGLRVRRMRGAVGHRRRDHAGHTRVRGADTPQCRSPMCWPDSTATSRHPARARLGRRPTRQALRSSNRGGSCTTGGRCHARRVSTPR